MKVLAFGLLAVLGTAALAGLGIWQLERLAWKTDLIERVSQRVHAPAAAAPGPAEWPLINAAGYEYRHVSATGRFLDDRATYVSAATELGSGFWVVTPLRTLDGLTLLVNRGFVASQQRHPATRTAGLPGARAADPADQSVRVTVTGLLRMTEPKGGFLRSNDPAADRWYSRDVGAIAAARRLSDVAPYFIDADAVSAADVPADAVAADAVSAADDLRSQPAPVGGLTVIAFPNNHLSYALTWFALALMLAGTAIFVGHKEWQLRRHRQFTATIR